MDWDEKAYHFWGLHFLEFITGLYCPYPMLLRSFFLQNPKRIFFFKETSLKTYQSTINVFFYALNRPK